MYTINYDIRDTDRSIAFVSRVREFGEVEVYLSNALFLDSDATCSEIYNRLKEELEPSDLFFIGKIDPKERNGWLNAKTIEWITKNENT